MLIRGLAICGIVLLQGCSSQRIELVAAQGQDSIIRDGVPALVSKKKHLVMLRPNSKLLKGNSRPAFTIVVRNLGNQPETLLESSITAQQVLEGKNVAVRVYRYEELVKEEQTRQTVAAVGTALAGAGRAMSASSAGYVTTTGTVNTYGSYGSSHGVYTATTYDPARAQAAQHVANAQTQSDFANLKAEGDHNLRQLQSTMLKDHTVMVGEWHGGSIVLDPPYKAGQGPTGYSIVVNFGGEQHIFLVSHVES